MHPFRIGAICLVILTFLLAIILYPVLPGSMPMHWNMSGEVDGTMPTMYGLFLFPLLMAGLSILMMYIPRFDPKTSRYKEFQGSYDGLILLFDIFFFVLFIITLCWTVGIDIPMNQVMPVTFAILMTGIAFFLRNASHNWFAGIRTPWTMESKTVWRETHKRGFLVFLAIAILSLCGAVVPDYAYLFIILPLFAGTIYLVVYSYLIWKKEIHSGIIQKNETRYN